jgi:acetoin utilization protein AcuB
MTALSQTVGALMSTAPMLINPDDPLDQAESVMRGTGARHWPVVRDRAFVGMLSLRDLLGVRVTLGETVNSPRRAGELMSRSRLTAHPDDDVVSTAAVMNRHRLWCLPVVSGDELVGVVTLNHFVEHAIGMLREEERELGLPPTVARLMTYAPLGTVGLLERVDVAQALMRAYQIRHLLVMRGARLIGVLSERDILEVLRSSLEPASAILVGEIMTSAIATTTPEDEAAEAASTLIDRNIGALPVVRRGRVIGILCKSDLLRYVIAMGPAPAAGAAA